jgi:cytochrome c-type biogenesis protein CcmF
MPAEAALPVLAAAALTGALAAPHRRQRLAAVTALALLGAGTAVLGFRFLTGDSGNALVFQYGGAASPWHLRLAGLWASDQGTLWLMALLLAAAATRFAGRDGWAAPGALALALGFTIGAAVWNPFAATTPEVLAGPAPGGNSHLANPWMAIHPPLILAAQALLLAPVGAAIEALVRPGPRQWMQSAGLSARGGWIILTASLAAGMWWAYQDFSFGQFWHWDPVQAAIFGVWMLATAQLHALEAHRQSGGRRFAVLLPALALGCGVLALVAMAVVRTPGLASSHRYVGNTSAPLLWGMALILVLAAAAAWLCRPAAAACSPSPRTALDAAIALLVLCAAIALLHLAHAFVATLLNFPRPESLKPFLEMLVRWAPLREAAELRRVFSLWEPDPVALNRWLVTPAIALALAGGHALVPVAGRRRRWTATAAAVAAAGLAAIVDPATPLFGGTGMTAQGTVDMLGWLAALWTALAYLAAASLARLAVALRRREARAALVGSLHLGVAAALAAFLAATVFDSHTQRDVRWPDDFGVPIPLPDGQSVSIELLPEGGGDGFLSTARVSWRLNRDGHETERADGLAHFRDNAPPLAGSAGSQRLVCEILDYRYARHVSGPHHMIDPYIHRGWWQDIQVWVPAVEYAVSTDGVAHRLPSSRPVVVKTFPLVSWMWGGIAVALLSAAALHFHHRRPGKRP